MYATWQHQQNKEKEEKNNNNKYQKKMVLNVGEISVSLPLSFNLFPSSFHFFVFFSF
jgi:hypothetical protein